MEPTTELLASLRLLKPNLSPALTLLADFIEDNLSSVSRMTVTELADFAQVSVSSVSRLSRELGYRSYSDFKMAAHSSSQSAEVSAEDLTFATLNEAEELISFIRELLKGVNVEELITCLSRCNTLFVVTPNGDNVQYFVNGCQEHGKRVVQMASLTQCEALLPSLGHKDGVLFVSSTEMSAHWQQQLKDMLELDCVTVSICPPMVGTDQAIVADYWVPTIKCDTELFDGLNIKLVLDVILRKIKHK